jgi:hypothetical protein
MPKSRVMSRQDFLTGVEKLLGRFDADSFMRGFREGRQRMHNEIMELLEEDMEFTRDNVIHHVRKLRRRRRS